MLSRGVARRGGLMCMAGGAGLVSRQPSGSTDDRNTAPRLRVPAQGRLPECHRVWFLRLEMECVSTLEPLL